MNVTQPSRPSGPSIETLQAENATLRAEIARLHQRIAELEAGPDKNHDQPEPFDAAITPINIDYPHLQRLFWQFPSAIAILHGPEHLFIAANERYQALVGEHRPLIGQKVCDAFSEVAEYGQAFLALLDQVYTSQQAYIGYEQQIRWNVSNTGLQQDAWLNMIYQPIVDSAGRTEGIVVYAVDVTVQVSARQELMLKKAEIARLNAELAAHLNEISHSQHMLQGLLDHSPIAIEMSDLQGNYLLMNRMLLDLLGLSDVCDAVGRPCEDFFDAQVTEWTCQDREQILATREPLEREYQIQLGPLNHTVQITRFPVYDEAGTIYAIGSLGVNITERKRTEQQLQRYADLIETTSDYIAMADSAGNTLYINQAGRQMQGYAADMPVSAMGVQRSHPDWVLNIMAEQAIPTAMREGTWHGETAIIDHCTGDEIPVSQVVLAHRSPDGQFDFFSTIMRDISERKRFEAELRTSEERFRNIVHHANEIIYTLSPDGRFTFVSPAWTRLLGHAIAEVEGHSFEAFVHPDDIAACQTFLIQVLSGQNALDSVEYRVCHKDGSWRWHMSVGSLVHDEEQNILYYVGIAQDTTERRQTAEALRQAKEAAEAANNAKSAFLAHMSHELRSPLNAILGFAQLLARDATLTPSQQEHLTIIRNSGEHLLNLINDVLDMSKIEAGRITVHAHPMDLHRLTHDLVEMFQLRAMEKQLRLQIDQSSAVPAFIDADERKLRQVLINLIGNALKFTDQGNVMVRIRCITQDNEINDHVGFDRHFTQRPIPDGLRLLVEVIDTGPGIPLEEQASIFEPFKQTNNKTLSQEGTGLGLAISRQFVRLMGGHLSLESTPGSGSCFRFDLPIYESRDQQARPPVASSHVLHLAIDQPSYRVLVVEDKWTNRQLLVSLLQPLGFQVREARHGQEALHICQTWSPHLIFMDIRMPIMDGYTATRAIHALPQGQSTIIIALTASVFEEERADIMTSGCADLIRKPFRYEEIIQALEKHLGAQFIYESGPARPTQPDAVLSDAYTLTPTALQHLSRDLLETLHAAAERCSVSLVLNVIEQIEPIDANLASTLTSIVNDFHFEQLTDILQPLLWPDESTEL